MNNKCSACGQSADLRPYGFKGALVCFTCAMSTPEGEAEAERQFTSQLAACDAGAVIGTEAGPFPLEHASPEVRAAISTASK